VEPLSSGLLALWLKVAGVSSLSAPVDVSALLDLPTLVEPGKPDLKAQTVIQQYLEKLAKIGYNPTQGIWLQSDKSLLADNLGTIPLPAASLTKIATSLAALETWGSDHQFETLIGATGPINNGVLDGDLVIQGSGDPFFVWEEGIALGNTLNKMGIRRITGDLIIGSKFYMNYEAVPVLTGSFLRQAINADLWTPDITQQYNGLPKGTPKPLVTIAGNVELARPPLPKPVLLIRHRSLPLALILKQMNIYSNNPMAEMLAESVGGAEQVAQRAASAAKVSQIEVQLVNGSGLGKENRLSPRAVCAMLIAIQRSLKSSVAAGQQPAYTIADLFPVAGRDQGTLVGRFIPTSTVIKTGTLSDVSTLAGIMPTRDRGLVYFAILNRGDDLNDFRDRQDDLLQTLVRQWKTTLQLPTTVVPSPPASPSQNRLGSPERNEIRLKAQ